MHLLKKLSRHYRAVFLGFLGVYIVIVLLLHKDLMEGDEGRYYMYAQNLLHGFFSPKDHVYIWNGPGYPIILMPFVWLKLPLVCITLMNAFFYYFSLVFFYRALLYFTSPLRAFVFSLFWACYYIAFKEMTQIYTEPFTLMLMGAFLLLVLHTWNTSRSVWPAGLIAGYIILTKVMFAYVFGVLFLAALVGWIFFRKAALKKLSAVFIIAFMVTVPWLLYTWHITGKAFYWAGSGASSLYWASTPYEGEFGDWNTDSCTNYCNVDSLIPCNAAVLLKNHGADLSVINQYTGIAKEDLYKRYAIRNIRSHPLKYLKNCVSNLGRLFFGIPQSFYYQRAQTLYRIPPNAIVFTFFIFNIIASCLFFRRLPPSVLFIASLSLLYIGLSCLLSTEQRHFYMVVPAILLWSACLLQRLVPRMGHPDIFI